MLQRTHEMYERDDRNTCGMCQKTDFAVDGYGFLIKFYIVSRFSCQHRISLSNAVVCDRALSTTFTKVSSLQF